MAKRRQEERSVEEAIHAINDIPVAIAIGSSTDKKTAADNETSRIESIKAQAKIIGEKGNNARDAMELLPDLAYGKEIIKSAIRNPNNSTDSRVDIRVETTLLNDSEKTRVINIINSYCETELKMNSLMNKMIEDTLFLCGAHVTLTMPPGLYEHVISNQIGPGLESFNSIIDSFDKTPMGLITKPKKSLFGFSFSDNIRLVTGPEIKKKQAAQRAATSYGLINYSDKSTPIISITKKDIEAAVNDKYAINTNISTDAFIPVFPKGETDRLLGGWIVLDEDCYPINSQRDGNILEEMRNASNKAKNDFIARAKKEMGITDNSKDTSAEVIQQAFKDRMDSMIAEAMQNTPEGGRIEVDCPKSVYESMLARAFKKKDVKLLYVDGSLLTYVAHFRTPSGLGESLLEKTALYSSLRIILRLGRINAHIENSTASTELNINVDEKETDPVKLAHDVASAYLTMNDDALPLGEFNLPRLQDRLRRARVKINMSGPGIPETKTEINKTAGDKPLPDSDLEESFKKDQFAIIGCPADLVDKAMEGDFAEGIKVSGALLERTIADYQTTFQEGGGELLKTNLLISGGLQQEILDSLDEKTLKNNEGIISHIVKGLSVEFPSPDSTKLESQKEAFSLIEELAEEVSMAWFNDDGIASMMEGDNFADKLNAYRVMTKNMLIRDWCQDNNVLPEFANLLNPENPNNISVRSLAYTETLYELMSGNIADLLNVEFKKDGVIDKIRKRIEIKKEKRTELIDSYGEEPEEEEEESVPEETDNESDVPEPPAEEDEGDIPEPPSEEGEGETPEPPEVDDESDVPEPPTI